MYDYNDDIDPEELAKFAAQMLERPSDMGIWDDRIYSTHGAFIAWAENADDILAESNYRTVREHLMQFTENENADEDIIDASFGHWAVGPLRQLFIRVNYEDGRYTPLVEEAYRVYLALQDYPVWDEDDYGTLEWEVTEKAYDQELEWLLAEKDNGFPNELTEDEADTLHQTWYGTYCGSYEPGYVDGDDILNSWPEAQKRLERMLQHAAGQVPLDFL